MLEIGRLAFSNIGALFDEKGSLRELRELPPAVLASVASVKTLKTNVVSGDGQQETTREVKLWDKLRALDLLAKHFGLVTDRHDLRLHEIVDRCS
jgi:phage terminase small subunit